MSEPHSSDVIHREIDTTVDAPSIEIARIVGELENRDQSELAAMYDCIDHMLDHMFSTPPADEAQMEVEFSYEGYRITLEQDGRLTLMKPGHMSEEAVDEE